MIEQLDLSKEDFIVIADLMDRVIMKLVPSWKRSQIASSSSGDSVVLQSNVHSEYHWDAESTVVSLDTATDKDVLSHLAIIDIDGNQASVISDESVEHNLMGASNVHDKPYGSDGQGFGEISHDSNDCGISIESCNNHGVYMVTLGTARK